MENLLYTTASSDSLLLFISQQRKIYKINIDFKDYLKYFDYTDKIIDHYVLNTVFIRHTQIRPIYKIIKRAENFNVIKVIIPSFIIYFPQYHNIKYTFNESSLNLMLQKSDFSIEYDDVVSFFDNGITNYLKRTVDSILSREFNSNSGSSLLCNRYKTTIISNYLPLVKG